MNLKKLVSLVPKSLLLLLLVTLVLSSFEGVVNSAVIGYLPNFSQNSTVTQFVRFVIISLTAFVIVYVSIWLFSRIENRVVYLLNTNLKSEYIAKATFQKIDTNKEISTLINDFKLIETNYFTLIVQIILDFCMALFSTLFVLKLNLLLGIVFIVLVIPQLFVPNLFQIVLSRRSKKWSQNNSSFVEKLRDLMGGRDTLLRYHAFKPAYEKIKRQLFATEDSYRTMNNSRMSVQLISWLWSLVATFVPISLGFYLMITYKEVNASIISSMYLASNQIMQPLREAINGVASVKTTKSLREEIESVFEKGAQTDNEIHSAEDQTLVLNQIFGKQVNFAFGSKQILRDASFVINKNDKILLTGASGMGKSTIFNLLMGAFRPASGQIIYQVNGQDEQTADPNMFALIQQAPYVFNETIRFNLGLGLDFPDKVLLTCLKEVGLDHELGSDPLNYFCQDGGSNLSGGQRERLEIARALAFDRQVILADEIDANLDPKNAFQVENLLAKIDKTVVMISHHMGAEQAEKFGFRQWRLNNGDLTEIEK
ncbi:ABC transporter ATP-binding protein [Lactobacillus sp. ESL0791]|uniref:ATP-binding cassette domain-containing protein n=1 Tax=Lactobacillus sp. ESL0791 TaxID=2983234 RepID=UPI0023F92B26|nr:ABC transporter ATP-binding protein [Lactobacillus sp. ESL0791]MDF7639651.1 ABC transporter ATP-binding protein [Lactobacillus sp. ESL0791]